MMKNIALILGGGTSSRCGFDKLFAEKLADPILYKTLKTFQKSTKIDTIILVLNEKHSKFEQEIYTKFKKVHKIIKGGEERFFSLKNGLNFIQQLTQPHEKTNHLKSALEHTHNQPNIPALKNKNPRIIVHNGANPFLSIADLESGIKLSEKSKNIIFGFFTTDSIKQVKNGKVCKFLNREEIFQTQTPQISDLQTFLQASNYITKEKNNNSTNSLELPKDEAELLALINEEITVYECARNNTKITFKEDFQ